jgi:hypothetical protein
MPQNFPFNGVILTNDIAVNDSYPKVQFGGTESGAVYFEDVEVAGTMYQKVQNASYDKWSNSWILVNPALPAFAVSLLNGSMTALTSPAGLTPFAAWQYVGPIVGALTNAGVQKLVPADGSASVTVTLSPGYVNAITVVLLSVGANYTGTDNAVIVARLSAEPTKSSFSVIVSGGQTGTTVDIHYVAIGS